MPNILILPTIYVFYTISGYRRYKIIVFWRSPARWGYRGAFCSACWVQWHWEHPFTHLKLFYFPNVIGLVQRIESFGLNAYQTESLVPNRSIRIWKWKKWSESDIQPSIVTHTRNSCSTFTHPSAHTHSSEWTHTHTVKTHTFTFMHFADAFIQSDLQCIQAIHFVSMPVPWELRPQPFALLTQCYTTEPQEHTRPGSSWGFNNKKYKWDLSRGIKGGESARPETRTHN